MGQKNHSNMKSWITRVRASKVCQSRWFEIC